MNSQNAFVVVKIENDARYPLNAIYSSDDVWKNALPLLEKTADVILMDLRGFTRYHKGCREELEYLRDQGKLHRTVFLIDGDTELPTLEALLDGHEVEVLDYAHPSGEERRALFDLLLNAAYG